MWLIDRIPYILAALTCLASAFELLKKKPEAEKPWFRIVSLVVLFFVAILSMITLHHERVKQAQDAATADAKTKTAKEDQDSNTARFLQSFKDLSGQVADLKTQVKTDALQKKLDAVQSELAANEKAMAPGPKASLAFTFWPFFNPILNSNVPPALTTDITAAVNPDNSVHFDFTVLNLTNVDALGAQITLMICDLCTFAKEPEGSTKYPGEKDSERMYPTQDISAKTHFNEHGVDIFVPPGMQQVAVGMQYRCRTCDVPKELSGGTIRLKRDFIKPF